MAATFPAIETRAPVEALSPELPAPEQPWPAWPSFSEEEVRAAARVLRSGKVNYWTGDEGRSFEREFAEFCNCRYAVALANGTVALELALRALGIGPGDEVVTTSRTFIATASSVVAAGARPVFADVDADSQNITAASVAAVLTAKTRAIIAVHLAGWPCEMDALRELARSRGIALMEDCAQAHGATYKGAPVGSLSDIGCFSFCQDKNMTTAGEGGMVVTDDTELWERMWAYKDHGKSYDAVYNTVHAPGFRWLHASFGSNWRLSEVQSATGRVALRGLRESVTKRQQNAVVLERRLSSIQALRVHPPPAHVEHARYKFYAFVQPEALAAGWSRDQIAAEISAHGVFCNTGSCSEIYLEAAFPTEMRPPSRLPVARELGETSLMFLVHPTLDRRHMDYTADVVERVMSRATR